MAVFGISNCRLHGLPSLSFGPPKAPVSCVLRSCKLWSPGGSLPLQLRIVHSWNRERLFQRQQGIALGRSIKPVAVTAGSDAGESGTSDGKRAKQTREQLDKKSSEIRSKVYEFFEKKSEYSWLLGSAVITAMIVIPSTTVNLVSMFQKNFLMGLAATFGLDFLFVLAADLFLILTDKMGHHQRVAGGPLPWIGPWEYTGYPKGYPNLLNYISYTSVGVGGLAILLSFFTANLPAALATFGPYLGVLFAQVAYERLVKSDRLPVFPLVPIVYTVYRFRQLSRGLALLPFITSGSGILSSCLNFSSCLWVLYLSMYLTQLPWLYSTWNSNRAT